MKDKPKTKTNWPSLGAALERGRQIKQELKGCDQSTGRQLISGWKEDIIAKFLKVMDETDDVDLLSSLDSKIALFEDMITTQRELKAARARHAEASTTPAKL